MGYEWRSVIIPAGKLSAFVEKTNKPESAGGVGIGTIPPSDSNVWIDVSPDASPQRTHVQCHLPVREGMVDRLDSIAADHNASVSESNASDHRSSEGLGRINGGTE